MAWLPLITVEYEGGYYSPDRNPDAPIRIYPDRTIEDDIATAISPLLVRERLSRKEFRWARKAARLNRLEGRA